MESLLKLGFYFKLLILGMEIKQLIRYFRDCYKADQRETNIWNIFDKRIEHLLFFSGNEELLTANLPHLYIEKKHAETILSTLQLYKKEKELYYFSFFIAGKTGSESLGKQHICAPMLYYPAEIFQGDYEDYFFKVDLNRQQVNYPLISYLDNLDEKSYEEDLFDALPKREITFETSQQLIKALQPYLTEVNFEEAYRYPEDLESEKEVRSQSRKNHLKLLPAGALGVIMNSKTTRGVLTELEQMQSEADFSKPLHAVFNPENHQALHPKNHYFLTVPTVLSSAQKDVLISAKKNPLNLVIGPPGTGKSFTIAALAIDSMSAGQSVLIASKTDTAVDVIADKIEKQIGIKDTLVRGGRSQYMQGLKRYLENILKGIGIPDYATTQKNADKLPKIKAEIQAKDQIIQEIEKQFQERVEQELNWANYIVKQEGVRFFIRRWIFNYYKNKIQKKNQLSDRLWDLINQTEQELVAKNQLLKTYIQLHQQVKVRDSLYHNRQELKHFLKAIKARRDATQETLFKQIDFSVILKAFPIWLVNLSDIYHVLPLQKESFDLAIIDEASQCDIASSLPILQRAKRVVIVGDDQQLRHISFLSMARQKQLMHDHNLMAFDPEKLNYRDNSILDLVRDSIIHQEQIAFLNEHYRSYPEIIKFSNQHFYGNALHVMKQTPLNEEKDTVKLIQVNGKRQKQGYNIEEAEQILAKIRQIMNEDAYLEVEMSRSVGVLSPFRDQVDYISKKIPENFSLQEIQKHDLMIGTAHSFQGNERDVMLISLAIDGQAPAGSLIHMNKVDVFNVSITRACNLQYIFSSIDTTQLNQNTLLYQYLSFIQKDHKSLAHQLLSEKPEADDNFLEDLEKTLKQQYNYHCFRAYPLAGIHVDLVVQHQGKTIGIDLIGYPGAFEGAFTLERYKMLNRAGLRIIPIPYTYWKYESELCLEVVRTSLE